MKKNKKKLVINWQRLVSKGNTCPRCGNTEDELDKAVLRLKEKLSPLGIEVILKKTELTLKEFRKDPIQSNKILFNGKTLESLIGAETGQSQCCYVCGVKECRTVKTKKGLYETIPAKMIVRTGLTAILNK